MIQHKTRPHSLVYGVLTSLQVGLKCLLHVKCYQHWFFNKQRLPLSSQWESFVVVENLLSIFLEFHVNKCIPQCLLPPFSQQISELPISISSYFFVVFSHSCTLSIYNLKHIGEPEIKKIGTCSYLFVKDQTLLNISNQPISWVRKVSVTSPIAEQNLNTAPYYIFRE